MNLLSPDEGECAIQIARAALQNAVARQRMPVQKLPAVFREKRGVFVTLTKNGDLRGCIGFPYPVMPLGEAIPSAAESAALQDPRFPPVSQTELPAIRLEVTVLTVPVLLECLPKDRPAHIEVGRHGLIIRGQGTSGLLLPQVATDYGWNATEFLDHTCAKAGFRSRCWDSDRVEVLTFEGQIFPEHR